MSATQAKATPSKAALELAKEIDTEWELVPDNGHHASFAELEQARKEAIEQVAQMCQSALSDLLEKAQAVAGCAFRMHSLSESVGRLEMDRLRKALEPWKVPE